MILFLCSFCYSILKFFVFHVSHFPFYTGSQGPSIFMCFYLHRAVKEYRELSLQGLCRQCSELFEKTVVELKNQRKILWHTNLVIKDGAFKAMMFFKSKLIVCLIFAFSFSLILRKNPNQRNLTELRLQGLIFFLLLLLHGGSPHLCLCQKGKRVPMD